MTINYQTKNKGRIFKQEYTFRKQKVNFIYIRRAPPLILKQTKGGQKTSLQDSATIKQLKT